MRDRTFLNVLLSGPTIRGHSTSPKRINRPPTHFHGRPPLRHQTPTPKPKTKDPIRSNPAKAGLPQLPKIKTQVRMQVA